MIRRLVAPLLIPLAVVAAGLAAAPWLRAFPASVLAGPLFGAVLLSTLLPAVVVALGARRLWISALVDVAAWLVFCLVVVLHEPTGFGDLWSGLVHGPSQLLTFALPLVSPRTLLVAPVTLAWLAGTVGGECAARRWNNAAPYLGWLVVLGLSVAATERTVTSTHDDRRVNLLLGVGLLVVMLLHRAAASWVQQSESATDVTIDGRLPLRSIGYGVLAAVAVAALAAAVVQAPAFTARAKTPQRVPEVRKSDPLTPLAFVSSLRPTQGTDPGRNLFTVRVGGTAPSYVPIADVDYYSGDGWSFQRTFRPSGGVVPNETDPSLRTAQRSVSQSYTIDAGPLTDSPWMPAMTRVRKITGVSVNVDAQSAMVVPTRNLSGGQRYDVSSTAPTTTFSDLSATSLAATSAPPGDTQLPGELRSSLAELVDAFAGETGTDPAANPIAFLLALQSDFQRNYALFQAGSPTGTSASAPSGASSSVRSSRSPTPSGSPGTGADRAGGTSFADVLASIVSSTRTATPEQYATMFALIARQLGIPARVATGFRLTSGSTAAATVPAGTYRVSTRQAWTWVEIPMRDHGWLVADVAPGSYSSARQTDSAGVQSSSSSAPPTQGIELSQTDAGHAVAPKSRTSNAGSSHGHSVWTLVWIAVVVVLVLILLVLLALLLRKRRRRRARLRAPDPRRRVLGAWRESLDTLSESGLPQLSTLTSTEVAFRTRERFGPRAGDQSLELGASANTAMYSSQHTITPADADRAWTLARGLRRDVRKQLDPRARVRSALAYHRAATAPPAGPGAWQGSGPTATPAPSRRGRRRPAGRRRAH